ncbi:hypothetical protein L7F22_042160 [Adiantum nelumboides]|nr:hypothetical protein [Adiantum nelumboides]
MSLLTDKDYLILSLRLAYLRRVDDHAGPRVITVPDIVNLPNKSQKLQQQNVSESLRTQRSFTDLDQIISASTGLNDARKHPELTTLHSPKFTAETLQSVGRQGDDPFLVDSSGAMNGNGELRDANRNRAASLGAGGLKHTTTIYGPGRTGALGMRVTGRRNVSIEGRRRKNLREGNEGGQVLGDEKLGIHRQKKDSSLRTPSGESTNFEKSSRGRLSDHSSTSTAVDGTPSDRSSFLSNQMQIPQVAVQPSSHDMDEKGNNMVRRASTMLRPSKSPELSSKQSETSLSHIKSRNRSSSQPHRPGLPSNLSVLSVSQSEHGMPTQSSSKISNERRITMPGGFEELNTAVESQQASIGSPSTSINRFAPPPRPTRRARKSISEQSSHSASAVPTSTNEDPDHQIDGRQRSQSEAIMPGSMPPSRPFLSTLQNTETQEIEHNLPREASTTTLGSALYMGRTQSESTIFSLASPRITRQRGLSNRSLQSDGSLRSVEAVANIDRQHSTTSAFAPVAEHPETHLHSDKDEPSESSAQKVDGLDVSNQEPSAYLLSPFNGREKVNEELGLFADGSPNGLASPLGNSGQTSSQQPIAPIATVLALDQGYASVDLTPGLSSAGGESEGIIRRSEKSLQPKAADLTSRTPSPFVKTNPATLKKQFDNRTKSSALTALLSTRSECPDNPFNQKYKNVAGSSVSAGGSAVIEVFFPFTHASNAPSRSMKPSSGALAVNVDTKSMRLSVRKDATMEELIGYGLYCYVEEGWLPTLESTLAQDATEEQREIRLIGKFGADELAICEATPAQIKQNQSASALLERRVSRQRQQSTGLQSLQPPTGVTGYANVPNIPSGPSKDGGGEISGSFGPATSPNLTNHGPPIFLRILVTPNKDVRYKTTLQVTNDRYLADVLETICKRRDLGSPEKWALVVPEKDIVVPLDRTVESLQGNYDLALVRRQDLGLQHSGAFTTQSTNPNASIFKRISQPEPRYQAAAKEIASVYKSYTVNRRMPTFLGRHERTLTIDGDWLHIIPTETRAFQTHTTTTSYPIPSIVSCTQSRLPSSFKVIVMRENDQKRYDFEAENSKIASEIVQEINALLRSTQGSASVRK